MESHDKFELANQRAKKLQASTPKVVSARYDSHTHRIVIHLSSKIDVGFSPHDAQGLEHAKPAQLDPIEVSPSGFGIHFPKLDADIYLPALLEGFRGSRKWMASQLGSVGGQAKSVAKTAAAQKNGLLGGRPRRQLCRHLKKSLPAAPAPRSDQNWSNVNRQTLRYSRQDALQTLVFSRTLA